MLQNHSSTKIVIPRPISYHRSRICHAKSYSLLRLIIEHLGIPSMRSCYKLQPHRHAIDTKLMNWLLIHDSLDIHYHTDVSECWLVLRKKLDCLLPLLQRCNGNVNFTDELHGQTILHVFAKKYIASVNNDNIKTLSSRNTLVRIVKLTKKLLEQGASVNITDNEGNTPMHYAAEHKVKLLISLLLNNFTNVNARNGAGNTVLHILTDGQGTTDNYKHIIDVLLSKGANANLKNNQENSPLHLSAKHCQLETLEIFKKHKVDFCQLGENGKNMLHFACASRTRGTNKSQLKKLKIIDFLAKEMSCDFNLVDEDGFTALHYAASYHGNNKVIRALMKLGADVRCRTNITRETPLHMAVRTGDRAAVDILLEFGAEVDAITLGSITPLHYTIIFGRSTSIMECLIRHGADVRRRGTIFNLTPVHMAALACKNKLELLIVSRDVEVNVKTVKGITPLHLASLIGNVEVMEILIEHGARVNCRDDVFGWSPLHWAAMKGSHLDVSSMFVDEEKCEEENSKVVEQWRFMFAKAFENQTTFDDEDESLDNDNSVNRRKEVMTILLDNGALAMIKDNKGHTPLYYVLENDNVEGLDCLLLHGVDVNDEDISRQVISCDNEVKHHVLWHAMKLKQIGFSITANYKFRTYHTDYWCEYRKCLNEVLELRSHRVTIISEDDKDHQMTLYDFLHTIANSRYPYVESVLIADPARKFPWYCDIIMASCREAVDRKLLMKPAKFAFLRLCGLTCAQIICAERVLSYLNNETLKAIVCSVEDV